VVFDMRTARNIELSDEHSEQIQRIVRARCASVRTIERARIILLANAGQQDIEIAKALGMTRQKVARWRRRFLDCGIDALYQDAPRSGRKKQTSRQKITMIVQKTLKETPRNATQWSTRSMAKAVGISAASVRRIWNANGLKPHLARTFKLSNDKAFEEKLEDIVGLYMNPPEHALVISCDEKSQIQALDRTQPGLPLKRGRAGTMTHDYVRNGTTTLFAALNTLDGTVLGMHQQKHRHQEWLKFLQMIDEGTPADKQLHLIVDNYATHKHPRVKRWLERHPRFHIHFTPTSASWLNAVERFFRDITVNRIRRGVFRSVAELEAAITDYIGHHNSAPKPFIWTASASDILEKVKRARKNLDKLQQL
jgi:transposase